MLQRPAMAVNSASNLYIRARGINGVEIWKMTTEAIDPSSPEERQPKNVVIASIPMNQSVIGITWFSESRVGLFGKNGQVKIYDVLLEGGKVEVSYVEDSKLELGVTLKSFVSWGTKIAFGDERGAVWLAVFDKTWTLARTEGHRGSVDALIFSGDGTRLATAGRDRVIKIWNTCISIEPELVATHSEVLDFFSVAYDEGDASEVHDLEVEEDEFPVFRAPEETIPAITSDEVLDFFSVVESDDAPELDAQDSEEMTSVSTAPLAPALARAKSEETQATEARASTIQSAGAQTTTMNQPLPPKMVELDEVATLKGSGGWAISLEFSTDTKRLVSGSMDNCVYLWDIEKQSLLAKNESHQAWVSCVAFSANNRFIASGSWDKNICLFDGASLELIKKLEFHRDYIVDVEFQNGALYSASYDGLIAKWNIENYRIEDILDSDTDWIQAIRFLNDGTLISVCSDGTSVQWSLPTNEIVWKAGQAISSGIKIGKSSELYAYMSELESPSHPQDIEEPAESKVAEQKQDHTTFAHSEESQAEQSEVEGESIEGTTLQHLAHPLPEDGSESKVAEQKQDHTTFARSEESEVEGESIEGTTLQHLAHPLPEDGSESKLAEQSQEDETPMPALSEESEMEDDTLQLAIQPLLEEATRKNLAEESENEDLAPPEKESDVFDYPPSAIDLDSSSCTEAGDWNLSFSDPEDLDAFSSDPPKGKLASEAVELAPLAANDIPSEVLDSMIDEIGGLQESSDDWNAQEGLRFGAPEISESIVSDVAPEPEIGEVSSPSLAEDSTPTFDGSGKNPPAITLNQVSASTIDLDSDALDIEFSEISLSDNTAPVDQMGRSKESTRKMRPIQTNENEMGNTKSSPRPNEPIVPLGFNAAKNQVEEVSVAEIFIQRKRSSSSGMGVVPKQLPHPTRFEKYVAIRTPHENVYGISISRNGERIASCGDSQLCIWSKTGEAIHQIEVPTGGLSAVMFTYDERIVAVAGDDGNIHLWFLPDNPHQIIQHAVLEAKQVWVTQMDISEDMTTLISAGYDGTVRVWDLANGECLKTLEGHTGPVTGLALGARTHSSGADGTIRTWNDRWKLVDEHHGFDKITGIAAHGPYLYVSAANGDVFSSKTGKLLPLLRHRGEARDIKVRCDGIAASGGEDGLVMFYQPDFATPYAVLKIETPVWDFAFNRNICVIAGDDGRIYLNRAK